MSFIKISVVLSVIIGVFSVKFPEDIERCRPGDNDCMIKVATEIFHNLYKGHPSINLVSLDPLHIPGIGLKQGAESPVNIDLKFHDVDLYGLKDFTFYKISGFNKELAGNYEVRLKGPAISLVGPYKISGRVLILPIQGTGRSNMTLVNPDIVIRFTGKPLQKNNKIYLHIDHLKFTVNITRLYMNLENLYNGDEILGNSTNVFLNENWQDIFGELKQTIFDAFGQISENVISNVLKKIPYKDLFINYD